MSPRFDYSDHVEQDHGGDSTDSLKRANDLARKQVECELAVSRAEAALAEAKAELQGVAERELPDLLAEIGLTEIVLSSGRRVTVKETIRASIPKQYKLAAHQWLEENGQGGLLKRKLIVAFNREQQEAAEALMHELRDRSEPMDVKSEMKVEPATLRAFVTRMVTEGHDIPEELFGVFRQRLTVIK